MKISTTTRDVLKNFSTINSGIRVKQGNKVETISNMKNILAVATVSEEFPKDFAIYNLPEFLGATSLLEDPDFEFNDASMTLGDAKGKGKYFYAEPSLVVTPPEKNIDMPESDINFELKNDVLEDIRKKANVLKLADIGLKSCPKSQGLYLYATNKNNDTSNDYSVQVGTGATKKFNIVFKKDNLKIIPGDYDVTIANGISHFVNKDANVELEYWIALEANSDYGE